MFRNMMGCKHLTSHIFVASVSVMYVLAGSTRHAIFTTIEEATSHLCESYLLDTVAAASLLDCAVLCIGRIDCVRFLYNRQLPGCELMDTIEKPFLTSSPAHTESTSPGSTVTNVMETTKGPERHMGAQLEYVTYGISMTSITMSPTGSKIMGALGRTLSVGDTIYVKGVPVNKHGRFSINLLSATGYILHFNPRFDLRVVVRNHQENGHWSTEVVSGGFPFKVDTPFLTKLRVIKQTTIKIDVEGDAGYETFFYNSTVPIRQSKYFFPTDDVKIIDAYLVYNACGHRRT